MERPHPRKTMKTTNNNIVLIIFLLMYEILSKLLVNRRPETRNRNFPAGKELRNGKDNFSFSQFDLRVRVKSLKFFDIVQANRQGWCSFANVVLFKGSTLRTFVILPVL